MKPLTQGVPGDLRPGGAGTPVEAGYVSWKLVVARTLVCRLGLVGSAPLS